MSGRLTIRFASDMPSATVDVVSPDMQVVDRVMLSGGRSRQVDVPSEHSFLRVHLPSGQVVTLKDPGSLDRQISMESIRRGSTTRVRAAGPQAGVEELPEEATFDAIRRYSLARQSAPEVSDGEGETLPLSSHATASLTEAGGHALKGVSSSRSREAHWLVGGPPSQRPLQFQIQHAASNTRVDMRIPGNTVKVWARSDLVREKRGLTFSIRVSSAQPEADTILGYLQRGDLYSAGAMAEWCDEAEGMLMSKMADPYAAAVGAYLLLKLKRFEKMRDWAKNLANWFDFLSDGSIIWATQLIQQQPANEAEIRHYLLRAAAIGPPVFSEGMTMLTDGLRLMGSEGRAALDQVLNDRDVLIPSSPLTAFVRAPQGYTRSSDAPAVVFDIAMAPR